MRAQRKHKLSKAQKQLLVRLCIVHLMHLDGYVFVDNIDRSFVDWDSSIVCSTFSSCLLYTSDAADE